MNLYALKDVKTGTFGAPLMGVNDGHISRSIKEMFGPESTPFRYPSDFELFQVGEFDFERTGEVAGELRYVCSLSVILQNPKD